MDIRKAFDQVSRNKILEKVNLKLDNKSNDYQFIYNMLMIDNRLCYEIGSEIINPNMGLTQGDPWSTILFNFMLDDALNIMNTIPESYTQAFADDTISQSKLIEVLQNALELFVLEISKIGLKLNYKKCELITDDDNDHLIIENEIIKSVKETKYLGHIIDSQGNSKVIFKESIFGKMIQFLRNNQLSKLCKIRLFKIYCKSKINHLLPLISMSGTIDETWKMIRKTIFLNILCRDTTPKECMALYGLGYYEVMIRPLIKIYNSDFYYDKPEERKLMFNSLKKVFTKWLEYEENICEELKNEIFKINQEEIMILNLKRYDEIRKHEGWVRIFRGSEVKKINSKLYPTIILYISNAKIHELEGRIINYQKLNITDSEEKRNEAKKLLIKMLIIIEFIKEYNTVGEKVEKNEWKELHEVSLLEEIELRQKVEKILDEKIDMTETFLKIESEVNINNSNNPRLKSNTSCIILESLRKQVEKASEKCLWDLERILDEDLDSPSTENLKIKKEKIKKEKKDKNQKREKVDINNTKLTEFFKV